MTQDGIPFSQEVRPTLDSERLSVGSHHYFFQLKSAHNDSKYLVISHRRQIEGKFVGQKLRIFEGEMLEFQRQLHKMCALALSSPETPQAQPEQTPLTVASNRYFTKTHHYFFELSMAANNAFYITIDQRKKVGEKYVGNKINIFPDAMPEFQMTLKKFVEQALDFSSPPIMLAAMPPLPTITSSTNTLFPPFFQQLLTTDDWEQFERYTHYLIKLLGIQNAYAFLHQNQAGKADGFFTIGNLAVLYDCTLAASQIDERKRDQIVNYCNLMTGGRIEINPDVIEEFHQYHQRQVWIITRNKTQLLRSVNRIEVKEVAVQTLIALYENRLTTDIPPPTFTNRLAQL
jgi:hypothetical protein